MVIFRISTLALAVGCAVAQPRGARNNGGGLRASIEEQRKLQMDMGGGGGGDNGGGGGLIEIHTCEPNPQRAIDYVDIVGYPEQGDMDCYVDPVGACGGGCCRFGTYFICDTGNFAPHLACVCNANTAPLPVTQPPVPVTPQPTTVPPTTLPPTTAAPAPTTAAPAPTTAVPAATDAPALSDIVQTAIGAGSFTTLVDLVSTAGLAGTLSSPGPFTVFAPTDAAFPTGAALLEFINSTSAEELTSILTYHVVPGVIMSSDLTEGAMVTTVQGSDLTISLTPGPMVNNANIVQPDIEASNGVIHVIDAVLIPPPPARKKSGPDGDVDVFD